MAPDLLNRFFFGGGGVEEEEEEVHNDHANPIKKDKYGIEESARTAELNGNICAISVRWPNVINQFKTNRTINDID